MNDATIVNCEKELAKTRQRLSLPDAERLGLYVLSDFIQFLVDKKVNPEPYLLRLEKGLPKISDPRLITGIDPDQIWPLFYHLHQLIGSSEILQKSEAFSTFYKSLRQHLIMLLAFVGEVHALFQIINDNIGPELVLDRPVHSIKVSQFNRIEILDKIISDSGLSHKFKEELARIISFWNSRISHNTPTVFIPVCNNSEDGLLRKISLDLIDKHALPYDEFRTDVAVIGAEKSGSKFNEISSDVARNYINKYTPHLAKNHFKGLVHFDMGHLMHDGDSAQVGLALLIFCGILHHSDQQEMYFPRTSLAISGALDENGRVVSVDTNSIKAKVNACFFSWINTLVVPASQADEFVKYRDALAAKYPNRELDIIPIFSFDDTLHDRRISVHKRFNTVNQALRLAWKRRTSALAVTLIISLISVIGMMWYGPIDKNPVKYEVEGEVISLYNRNDVKVNEFLWNDYSSRRYIENKQLQEHQYIPIGLFDLFGDGKNHLVLGTIPSSDQDFSSGKISAFDSITGDLIWEFTPHFEFDYPFKPNMNNAYMLINIFQTSINKKNKLVMIIRERNYFSNIIATVDPKTGKMDSDYYVHNGAIMAAYVFEDKDYPNPLIAIGGIANYNNSGFVSILDLSNIKGHGPTSSDYVLNGHKRAKEIGYMVFPRTFIGEFIKDSHGRPSLHQIRINFDEEELTFAVADIFVSHLSNNQYGLSGVLGLYYYTDFDLNIKRISTTDAYDQGVRALLNAGLIDSPPDHTYFQDFIQNEIKYYHNEQWISVAERRKLMSQDSVSTNSTEVNDLTTSPD